MGNVYKATAIDEPTSPRAMNGSLRAAFGVASIVAGSFASSAYAQIEPEASMASEPAVVDGVRVSEPATESSITSAEDPSATVASGGSGMTDAPLDVIPVPDRDAPKVPVTDEKHEAPIEEVIVTAQKRTERLQDIPGSVTVVNAEKLQDAGVTQLEDITKVAPSIQLTGSSGGKGSVITVRGVRTEAASVGVPAKAGVVVDDIPQSADARWFYELADIERMEVLVGPQSTVSPRNASGGLINIVTRRPTDVPTGQLMGSYTNDNEVRSSLFLSGPLVENELLASLSGYYNDWAGNIVHDTRGRDSGREAYGVRAKLLWMPAEDWEVTATGQFGQLRQKDGTVIYEHFDKGAAFLGVPLLTPQVAVGDYDYSHLNNNRTDYAGTKPFQNNDFAGGSLRIQTSVWGNDLMSISGIQKDRTDGVLDLVGLKIDLDPVYCQCQYTDFSSKLFSQELRLVSPSAGRVTYVAGLVYLNSTVTQDQQRPLLGPSDTRAESGLKNYAAYGRSSIMVTDEFEVTAGLRYNVEEISYDYLNRGAYLAPLPISLPQLNYDPLITLLDLLPVTLPISPSTVLPTSHSGKHTDRTVIGDLSLQYHFSSDVMGYFRYARGYQGPVYDLGQTGEGPYEPTDPEYSNAFELGLKSQWFNRRLTFNTAIFTTVYTNYQAQTAVVKPTEISVQLLNVGKLNTRGIETSILARIFPTTTLDLSATYLDPTIKHIDNAPCYPTQTKEEGCVNDTQDLDGKHLNGAPDFRIVGGLTQVIPFDRLPFDLSLRLDARYQSDVNVAISNDPATVQKAFTTANATLKLTSKSDAYELAFFVQNLANQHYAFSVSDAAGFWGNKHAIGTKGLPRDWERFYGLRLTYNLFK